MSIASAISAALTALRVRTEASITYTRGGDSSSLSVTVGKTDWPLMDTNGVQFAFETRDYLIAAADLVVDGTTILPRRDDVIVEVDGSRTYTYRVLDSDGIPPYRFSDTDKTQLRIHTKIFTVT